MARLRGGVIKRGRGWSYVIRVTDPATGVSRPRWVGGFCSEEEAKSARDEARRRARRGEYVDRTSITVGEYLRQWLDAHSLETKPKTLAGYRWLLERYVLPRIGAMRMQGVRPSDLSLLYRGLLDGGGRAGRPLSPSTVDAVHAVLRKAFNDAVTSEQVLESNPVMRAKRPRPVQVEAGAIWTPAQLAQFLEYAKGHRLSAFFYVAAFTGARRGELLNLSWSEVDLAAGSLVITGSASVVEGQRIVGTTKGGRRRTVSIDPSTVRVLQAHRARQAEERLIVECDWPESDLVFRTAFGKPLYPDTPSQLFPKLVAKHNLECPSMALPQIRLHDLRHIHATTLLLAGEPVHVVAARLGHADPSVTLRVYAHVVQDLAPTVADTFARAVYAAAMADSDAVVSNPVSRQSSGAGRG
jgi:integrase